MANNPVKFVQQLQGRVRIVLDAVDNLKALGSEWDALGYEQQLTDEMLSSLGLTAADVIAAMQAVTAVDTQMTGDGIYTALYKIAG